VPLPWSGTEPPYGFSPDGTETWLDQPGDWAALTVAEQESSSDSMLALYRAGLRLRRSAPWGEPGDLRWLPAPDEVLAIGRGELFVCVVNFGHDPYPLPAGAEVLIVSGPLEGGAVPRDTTVWLEVAGKTPTGPGKEER
jgi:alpha-glucosidase